MGDTEEEVIALLRRTLQEVREAFRKRGTEVRRESRSEALEEAAMAIQERRCEQSLHGSCGHQPCDYYARAMAAVVALKGKP